ncbi:MAG: Holliday junction resolvase RuvX [Verrucomicrobia bacterium]|nr:Holliday junction resolvase RuvX [Verrucomicrobiota bacterium]MBV8486390.1 Holliday junction resolvase RuvX [Verrucomicrobiota bacterium]
MRCLGIDFGSSRIGIAVSDDLGMLAHPLETIPNDSEFLSRLQQIALEKGVSRIVVGIPRNMDGSYGPAAEKAKLFLAQLKSEFAGVQLIAWDERLTTVEAQRLLHAAGRDIKKSRPVIDQVAAQVLLQSYLDSVAEAGSAE